MNRRKEQRGARRSRRGELGGEIATGAWQKESSATLGGIATAVMLSVNRDPTVETECNWWRAARRSKIATDAAHLPPSFFFSAWAW